MDFLTVRPTAHAFQKLTLRKSLPTAHDSRPRRGRCSVLCRLSATASAQTAHFPFSLLARTPSKQNKSLRPHDTTQRPIMLRVQRTTSDGAQGSHRLQQQQQQHVALMPRPVFHSTINDAVMGGNNVDASMMTMAAMLPLDDDGRFDSMSQLRPQQHQQPQLHHVHHNHLSTNSYNSQQHVRLSHSAKARKIKSAGDGGSSTHSTTSSSSTPSASLSSSASSNGTTGTGCGRKVLKQEVTHLQQLVNGMQQQVNAATREIQELRNMVGLMADDTVQQQQQQQHQQHYQQQPLRDPQPPADLPQQQQHQEPLSCAVTPLMDIYQQNDFAFAPQELSAVQQSDLAEHFGFEANNDNSSDDVQNSLYCKMEQELLGDDDDFQLFFQN